MSTYHVYEVYEERLLWKRFYEIEADDADQALEIAQESDLKAPESSRLGDGDYCISGWAVRPLGNAVTYGTWDEAWGEAVDVDNRLAEANDASSTG